jgi:hypothetical protein
LGLTNDSGLLGPSSHSSHVRNRPLHVAPRKSIENDPKVGKATSQKMARNRFTSTRGGIRVPEQNTEGVETQQTLSDADPTWTFSWWSIICCIHVPLHSWDAELGLQASIDPWSIFLGLLSLFWPLLQLAKDAKSLSDLQRLNGEHTRRMAQQGRLLHLYRLLITNTKTMIDAGVVLHRFVRFKTCAFALLQPAHAIAGLTWL